MVVFSARMKINQKQKNLLFTLIVTLLRDILITDTTKFVSNAFDFITALKVNGKELQGSAFYDALGVVFFIVQLSTGLLWASIFASLCNLVELVNKNFLTEQNVKKVRIWISTRKFSSNNTSTAYKRGAMPLSVIWY